MAIVEGVRSSEKSSKMKTEWNIGFGSCMALVTLICFNGIAEAKAQLNGRGKLGNGDSKEHQFF